MTISNWLLLYLKYSEELSGGYERHIRISVGKIIIFQSIDRAHIFRFDNQFYNQSDHLIS